VDEMDLKIISHQQGQQVPVGELTILGIATDNATTDCTVYTDWNNLKPFQTAVATGPGGVNDYSRWTFTYTNNYHLITNGTNNLTSKLSCIDDSNGGTANLTKFYSVNVIGIATTNKIADTTSIEDVQQEPSAIESNNTTALSNEIASLKKNSNTTTDITLNNRPTTVVEEGVTANNISSQTSPPIPLVANGSNLDRVKVNITSHKPGQEVLTGNLTIAGLSSDNVATDCTVYAGWDGQKPFQNTKALGPGGVNDYSTWAFIYTPAYHAITNKTNQLTAQISCLDDNANNNNNPAAANLTKSYSVNVIGIPKSSAMVTSAAAEEEEQNNGTASSIITSPKSIPSVPTPLPLLPPIQEQEEEKDEDNEEESQIEPEPETEPEPEPETEDDDDTTIYWDIEEDLDEDNEEVFDFEDNIFDLE
jgi:hypothetical protein